MEKLNILVVEPDFNIRNSLIMFLHAAGANEISEARDYEELLDSRIAQYDLIFINVVPGLGLTGPEVIRFLTRLAKVSKWCKFVLIANKPNYKLTTTIYRPIRTELITIPTTQKAIVSIVLETQEIQKAFKPVIEKLYSLPAREIAGHIKDISGKNTKLIKNDDVIKVKINLLLRAKKWSVAYSLASNIKDEHERYREQMHLLSLVGNSTELTALIATLNEQQLFQRGCIYYAIFQHFRNREYDQALQVLGRLRLDDLTPSEAELYAILEIISARAAGAIRFLGSELDATKRQSHHRFRVKLAKLRCLSWISITDKRPDMVKYALSEINEALSSDIWEVNKLARQTKLFVRLGLLLRSNKDDAAQLFDVLMKRYTSLHAYQLNVLLYAANILDRMDNSYAIHLELEKRRALLEMSPELLTFNLLHQQALLSSMSPSELRDRLVKIARKHSAEGREYRAIERYYDLHQLGMLDEALREEFDALKETLEIPSYWGA